MARSRFEHRRETHASRASIAARTKSRRFKYWYASFRCCAPPACLPVSRPSFCWLSCSCGTERGSESPDRGGRPDHRYRRRLGDVLCRRRRGRRPAAAPARRGPPLVVRGSCDPDRGHLHRLSGRAHDLDQLLRPHFTRVRGPCELRFHHHGRGHAAGAPQHLALGGAGAVVLGPDRPYRAGRGAHRQGAHLPCYGDIFCRRQRDLALRE